MNELKACVSSSSRKVELSFVTTAVSHPCRHGTLVVASTQSVSLAQPEACSASFRAA
jgi:hypothetical protein